MLCGSGTTCWNGSSSRFRQKYLLSFSSWLRLIKRDITAPLNDMATSPKRWLTERMVSFVARITPPCHDITPLLSQSIDRQLPVRTPLAIRLHFEICVWCKRYGQQLEVIRNAGRSFPERADLLIIWSHRPKSLIPIAVSILLSSKSSLRSLPSTRLNCFFPRESRDITVPIGTPKVAEISL